MPILQERPPLADATPAKPKDKHAFPDQHERGRHCVEPGCITTLTIWNPGPACYAHTQKHDEEAEHMQELEAA